MSTKKCWETKQSKNYKRDYFVNKESGVSQWGKQNKEDILPAGWEYCIAKSGNMFYYNMHYKRAQWEKPNESDKLTVPEGFEEKRSTNCRNVYYVDSKTGKTQWTYPEEKETRESKDLLGLQTRQSIDDDSYVNQELDLRTQKSVGQKVRDKPIKKRTPTRNNHKKMIEKNRKLHNLISFLSQERSKDTEDFKTLSHEIQKTKEEIRALSNELDKKEDEELKPRFKFNINTDEDFYDARRTVQKDIRDKVLIKQIKKDLNDNFVASYLENEELYRQAGQSFEEEDSDTEYDSADESADESADDEFFDAHDETRIQMLANQLLAESRQKPIVDQYREEKSVAKDGHGIGLPYPRQKSRALSRESLSKHEEQEALRDSHRDE